ncbi:MAG: peptidoglycan-binding domain-containing protein [Gaiellaceae bacterium]
MPGRRSPRRPDPDDWFAGPEPSPPERPAEPTAPQTARAPAAAADDEDWLGEHADTRAQQGPRFAASLSERPVRIFAVGLLAACLLLGGLSLAGVFTGSKHPRAATHVISTPATPAAPTTTQAPAATVPPPTTTLKPGDQGTQVKALQRALAQLGYAVGVGDGNYGPATKAAVAQFQSAAKLTVDGIVGPATLAALTSALRRTG